MSDRLLFYIGGFLVASFLEWLKPSPSFGALLTWWVITIALILLSVWFGWVK